MSVATKATIASSIPLLRLPSFGYATFPWLRLPEEVWHLILNRVLEPCNVPHIGGVCHLLRYLTRQPEVWKGRIVTMNRMDAGRPCVRSLGLVWRHCLGIYIEMRHLSLVHTLHAPVYFAWRFMPRSDFIHPRGRSSIFLSDASVPGGIHTTIGTSRPCSAIMLGYTNVSSPQQLNEMYFNPRSRGGIFYHVCLYGNMFNSDVACGQSYGINRRGNVLYCVGGIGGSIATPHELSCEGDRLSVKLWFNDRANASNIELIVAQTFVRREYLLPVSIRRPSLSDQRIAFIFHYDLTSELTPLHLEEIRQPMEISFHHLYHALDPAYI